MRKYSFIICHVCEGHGKMDNPAFENGFTSSEWADMEPEEHERIMSGTYDVPCTKCGGSGKLKVPNMTALTFAEKRELVEQRRTARELAEVERIHRMERMERMLGC
ncbi:MULTISPECIES: hypothetical protein [Brenneria]|uniref:Uncharacterized protein n=1 Tax=Brenneria nigrifluens DSM 30175 = ATCC 13028 TaxID=1121120 RepID=A0A2U1UIJ8_9GAMM|nr:MULTISPECIES: hypothetical protein [Brenneria]EHD21288.1 hypothetical protein BrE312_1897 [Brenneria sp. EniD312]PWC21483.1 hypothetical protein DDT54_18800 [Brenneria nigrifluens DSM 30175 = ATCC 13028]QCR04424.1 hypothetical protein EH206_09710 [Brenneria nigrifluens DSM 30175 = ATCC 13028]